MTLREGNYEQKEQWHDEKCLVLCPRNLSDGNGRILSFLVITASDRQISSTQNSQNNYKQAKSKSLKCSLQMVYIRSLVNTRSSRQSLTAAGLAILGSTDTTTTHFTTIILPNDTTLSQVTELAKENKVATTVKEESSSGVWVSLLLSFLPIVIIIFFFYMMMGQQGGGGGGGGRVMNFGKSKAKEADKKANRVRFSDVAGAEEEKQELVEVVEFSERSTPIR